MGLINIPKRPKLWKPPYAEVDGDDPLAQGLVCFPLMNEDGGKIVKDLSGNGNTGTHNAVWGAGNQGPALFFTAASSQYVSIPDSPKLSSLSMTIIVSFKGSGTGQAVYYKGSDDNNREYVLFNIGGDLQSRFFESGDKDTYNIATITAYDTANWHQVASVYDDPLHTAKIYQDGVFIHSDNTNDVSMGDLGSTLNIGRYGGGSLYLDGVVSYLMIYNRALSASEIDQLYQEPFRFLTIPRERALFVNKVEVVGANPKNPLGHPLYGALAGPISF